eukprot:gene23855-24128_t
MSSAAVVLALRCATRGRLHEEKDREIERLELCCGNSTCGAGNVRERDEQMTRLRGSFNRRVGLKDAEVRGLRDSCEQRDEDLRRLRCDLAKASGGDGHATENFLIIEQPGAPPVSLQHKEHTGIAADKEHSGPASLQPQQSLQQREGTAHAAQQATGPATSSLPQAATSPAATELRQHHDELT